MAEIIYFDEKDLQRKIKEILNKKGGFHFEITPHNFDLVDEVEKIYIEVKTEDFAPAQLLYAIAKEEIKDIRYIGLACDCEVRFYKPAPFDEIESLAREIDSNLDKAPSNINYKRWEDKAYEKLGKHIHIYTYEGELDITEEEKRIFIDQNNYEYFARIFYKYDIDPSRFITFITTLYENNEEIRVNNDGRIININSAEFFRDIDMDSKQTNLNTYKNRFNYKPIKDFRDKTLLESTRVTSNEINNVLKQMDRLEPRDVRRNKGRFFTHEHISETISNIVHNIIKPDYILEPFVGTGSLIDPLVKDYNGAANDIVKGYIETLRKNYNGLGWIFTALDTIATDYKALFKKWEIPIGENVLILTNPPFGTSSTNALASRNGEVENGGSRGADIYYGGLGDKYGRGDLVLPSLAKCIEIIKRIKNGYIATFSPAGVMLNRYRYKKLFGAFLKDFEFIEGHIFSGENFNSVSKKKPIAFTIWKYNLNYHQQVDEITFNFYGDVKELKELPLLKEYWRYRDGSIYVEEKKDDPLGVFRCERFNVPNPKMFSINLKEGSGAELSEENIKKTLNLSNIPDELAFGLWSISVGYLGIADFPICFNECYTHLPNFDKRKTKEILAYALISALIDELHKNYCKGKIGFIGGKRVFKFGNERLTEGAKYLIKTYGECSIGDKTIKEVFKELQNEPDITKIDDSYRSLIKGEIEQRLESIGYWEYLPIPEVKIPEDKGLAKLKGIGSTTKDLLKRNGIDSIKKLSETSVEDLCKIKGIGKKSAERYIDKAEEYAKEKITYFLESSENEEE